jgi:hypothetical protein
VLPLTVAKPFWPITKIVTAIVEETEVVILVTIVMATVVATVVAISGAIDGPSLICRNCWHYRTCRNCRNCWSCRNCRSCRICRRYLRFCQHYTGEGH